MALPNTLTPDGARRLRRVRDHILAHPDTFDWSMWCGTRCCIAGHLIDFAKRDEKYPGYDGTITGEAGSLLGFDEQGHPELSDLFYGFGEQAHNIFDAQAAAKAIDAFLWRFGYPPHEVTPTHDPLATLNTIPER